MKSGKGEGDGYRKEKSMAAVICIFLIFVTFASLFYVAREEDHNCTGKDCPICACVH